MSELVADIAATAGKVAVSATVGLLPTLLPWLAGAAALVALAGAGGTVWYRMQWLDCKAAGAQALADQRDIDRRDNSKAVSDLTNQLNRNVGKYESAMAILNSIPVRNNACERDTGVRAARDILCSKFPESPSCVRLEPTPKVP